MVTSKARTPGEYVASLPDDRRAAIAKAREVVNANLPEGTARHAVPGGARVLAQDATGALSLLSVVASVESRMLWRARETTVRWR